MGIHGQFTRTFREYEPYFKVAGWLSTAAGGGVMGYFSPLVTTFGLPLSVVIGLILALALLLFLRWLINEGGSAGAPKPLKEIVRQTFVNQTVVLGGHKFVDCRFDACTLEYNGGDVHLDGSHIGEDCRLVFGTRESIVTAELLYSFFVVLEGKRQLVCVDKYGREKMPGKIVKAASEAAGD